MKYTNHLNVIVAIIGVIVIVQTLTGTFWNSAPEQQFSVQAPPVRPKIEVQSPRTATGQRRSVAESPRPLSGILGVPSRPGRQVTGPGAFAGRDRLLTGPSADPGTNPAIAGAASGTAGPNTVVIPSVPTNASPTPGTQGDTQGRSSRTSLGRGRSLYRGPGLVDRQLNLPPPGGNEAAKRRPDENAPVPPVRSSMPDQRIQ